MCILMTFIIDHLTPQQMDLKADVRTVFVTELSPKTDYSLTLYAVYPSLIGDSATITIKTGGLYTSVDAEDYLV